MNAVPTALPILDCHQHFFDVRRLGYPVFERRSPGFEALVGDYAALPRVYLPEDYGRDVAGWPVVSTVWAEFMADDPGAELQWVRELAGATGWPAGMIAQVDFASPELGRMLDFYASVEPIRAVRQHLGWHPTDPLLRYASRPDFLTDPGWRHGLAALHERDLRCELEVFAPQLPDLAAVAAGRPDIQFVVPVMGWPVDLTREGRWAWKHGLAAVAACANVAVKIFGLECIFGVAWTVD
jgi:predicted TIM-barrel fold metal-dependent hydrolase